jgi:hypothetical protein
MDSIKDFFYLLGVNTNYWKGKNILLVKCRSQQPILK